MKLIEPESIKKHYAMVLAWLLRFLHIQLFVTLISLPILLSWGLPISLLSPLGNLIFSPFLTFFLLLSTLIFFTELVFVPNYFLIKLLDWFTACWMWVLGLSSKDWLIGFVYPSLLFTVVLISVSICIVCHKRTRTTAASTICFLMLFFTSCGYLHWFKAPITAHVQIPCNGGFVTLIKHKGKVILVDPGYIGRRLSAPSWVEHTLVHEMHKNIGTVVIDHALFLQPSSMTFVAMLALCKCAQVKKIYLPCWSGSLERQAWHHFFVIKEYLKREMIQLVRISGDNCDILDKDDLFCLKLEALDETIVYKNVRFKALHVRCMIDKMIINLYSAKSKKNINYALES